MNRFKMGFTLAEIIITLSVIGIVSAITMPRLITNIQEKQRAEQIRTVKYKFTKATDTMNSLGLIGHYNSSLDFVNELSKHLKIAKICDSNNLSGCWPYEKINLSDGSQFNVSDIVDGSTFKRTKGDWSSPVVGIITGDGTPMILTYRKDCEPLDSAKQYVWSSSDGKPVTNATTNCVSAIFEISGRSGKNKFKNDVAPFNANGLGTDCAIGTPMRGRCFGSLQGSTFGSNNDCIAMQESGGYGSFRCGTPSDKKSNSWIGAVKECGGTQYMPSGSDLNALASIVYNKNISGSNKTYNDVSYDSKKAQELGLPEEAGFTVWINFANDYNKASYAEFQANQYTYGVNHYTGVYYKYMCLLE